jgi:hypothetical protein
MCEIMRNERERGNVQNSIGEFGINMHDENETGVSFQMMRSFRKMSLKLLEITRERKSELARKRRLGRVS